MKNKFVIELTIETDQDLTKKRVKELLLEALTGLEIENLTVIRVRSVDKD